jgi:hypothetical protein
MVPVSSGMSRGITKAPSQEIDGKVNDKAVKLPNPAYDEWYASDQSAGIPPLLLVEGSAAPSRNEGDDR